MVDVLLTVVVIDAVKSRRYLPVKNRKVSFL